MLPMAYSPWQRLQDLKKDPLMDEASLVSPNDYSQDKKPSEIQQPQLQAIPLGSGLKQNSEINSLNKNETIEHKGLWATPEEAFLHEQIAEAMPMIEQQKRMQEQNKRLFGLELSRPVTPDLAYPLSLAAHAINPNYDVVPPQAPSLSEKEIREWAKQQQDDQRDLSRTITQAQNAQKIGFQNNEILELLGLKKITDAGGPAPHPNNANNSNWLRWTSLVEKPLKEDQMALSEANQLKAAINGSPAAQRGVPLMLAKMLTGASRVPVQEAMMEKGDPAFANTIEQKWNTLANGEITPQNKGEYLSFINTLMELHRQGITRHTEQGLARGRPLGLSESQMKSFLSPNFTMPQTSEPSRPKLDINALLKQELERESTK